MNGGYLWEQLRSALRSWSKRNRSARQPRARYLVSLAHEQLEQRELLSVNQITFDAVNRQVIVSGTSDADHVSVTLDSPLVVRIRAESTDGIIQSTFHFSSYSSIAFFGGAGNDIFENSTNMASVVRGDAGDDYLSGGGGADDLQGGIGNDTLLGLGGNDQLQGGDGIDLLLGGIGNDTLTGNNGNDELQGGDGNDVLYGSTGNDRLLGGTGYDRLLGGADDDYLAGEAGNDDLQGGDGVDILLGNEGSDRLLGGEGNDQLVGHDGNDYLAGEGGNDDLQGGNGHDTLIGSLGNDRLLGGEGYDQLVGSEGDDYLAGEGGNDQIYGGDGIDTLLGGLGDDRLLGGDGDDTIVGNEGNDHLAGEYGNDELQGNDGHDVLVGDAGNDRLLGGEGNDQLLGGESDDYIAGEGGNDQIYGGAGIDSLLGGLGDDRILGGDGDDMIVGNEGADHLAGEGGNDELLGNDGNDTLIGDAGNDRLLAGEGDDQLVGGADDDHLAGEGGNDQFHGGAGIDTLLGGLGNDLLLGGDGDDIIVGNEGSDQLAGEAGNDNLQGNAGNDTLYGGFGNDYLTGNEGVDWVFGEEDNDELIGWEGSDILLGGAGNDRISVASGQHMLVGGAGNDDLAGGTGNDVLIGGDGVDQVRGYGGDDLLIGGTTLYDDDIDQLTVLLGAWTAAAPYATRVAQIEDELFAAPLESNETVFDDLVADAIYGNEGQDWFFLTGFMGVYDPNLAGHHDHGQGAGSAAETNRGAGAGGHTHSGPIILDHVPAVEGFSLIDSLDKLNDRQATESLHTLVPHADDPALQREHLSLFQLVRYDQITHYAAQSGAWSDPATWHDGMVPAAGARVLIPIGVEVTVDTVISTRLSTIRVDGRLAFSTTANSELLVDTIVVASTGRFEMGTEETPIPANLSARLLITDNGPLNRVADPFGIGRGLIAHGSVSMHGAAVTAQVAVNGAIVAGTNLLSLKAVPNGWKVGDSIVVASSTAGAAQTETRQIAVIFGSMVMVDRAFDYNHTPAGAGFEINVANTTRNISISSESSVVDRRGHVMFMHNRDVHIAHAGFYKLGRTDKLIPINDSVVNSSWQLQAGTGTNSRGRYAVHFHRNGFVRDGNPATIFGSAVVDSPGWGFVNHSSYVDMTSNVAYGVRGAAFATEVGDEIGSFVNNIALGSTGSGEVTESRLNLQDFGHQGDGFWFQGPGVAVTGNIAAGNDGNAFIVFSQGLIEGGVRQRFLSANLADPSIAGGQVEIDIQHVPMLRFDNNVGYASQVGLGIWYQVRDAAHNQQGIFENSSFWNNSAGVDLPYSHHTTLRNLRIVQQPPSSSVGIGVGSNVVTRDITYDNLTVTGYHRGIIIPRRGYAVVQGGVYVNHDDFLVFTGVEADRQVLLTGPLQMGRLVMALYTTPFGGSTSHLFNQDMVTLNFGTFHNQRVYYAVQQASVIPFPTPFAGLPSAYVGLTTQQLWTQHGVAIGGAIAPSNAISVPSVIGLVGPAT